MYSYTILKQYKDSVIFILFFFQKHLALQSKHFWVRSSYSESKYQIMCFKTTCIRQCLYKIFENTTTRHCKNRSSWCWVIHCVHCWLFRVIQSGLHLFHINYFKYTDRVFSTLTINITKCYLKGELQSYHIVLYIRIFQNHQQW